MTLDLKKKYSYSRFGGTGLATGTSPSDFQTLSMFEKEEKASPSVF